MNDIMRHALLPADQQDVRPYMQLAGVSKVFESKRGAVEALRDVTLDVRAGQFISVVGPSGCGKSTLLRCIAGLDRVTSGDIVLNGERVTSPSVNMGMVFQRDVLLDWRTVLDNVLFATDFRDQPRSDWIDRARSLLDLFGLDEFHNRYPWELSGGMRMRVAICRALLVDPELLLMDEPFAALDAFTRDDLNLELQRIWLKNRCTAVFITHNITEAIFLADRVVVMDRRPGRIALVLDVQLPRPRELALRETPEFASYGGIIRRTFEDLGVIRAHA